jgi:membrane associated rhomboid family serine protease
VPEREPIFNVPGAVLAILAVFIVVHLARSFMSIDEQTWFILALAFIPARYSGLAAELPGGEIASVTSFITHMFVHGDWVHLGINSAWMLAFGTVLCRRLGALRFLVFSALGGVAGALLFLAFHSGSIVQVVGASGAISAMMGGVMRFLFNALDRKQGYLLRENPQTIAGTPLSSVILDRRILFTSLAFIGLNCLAIVGFGGMGTADAIAWEAHLGGYFFGLLAFGLFDVAPRKPFAAANDE